MCSLTVTRFAYAPAMGTYGYVDMPDGQRLYTVEQPWNDNKVSASCIPTGSYVCRPRRYHRGGYDAVEITKVPGRKYILFHVANVPTSVRGCIGVGTNLGWVKGQWAVTASRLAFGEFMRQVGGKEFTLTIENEKHVA